MYSTRCVDVTIQHWNRALADEGSYKKLRTEGRRIERDEEFLILRSRNSVYWWLMEETMETPSTHPDSLLRLWLYINYLLRPTYLLLKSEWPWPLAPPPSAATWNRVTHHSPGHTYRSAVCYSIKAAQSATNLLDDYICKSLHYRNSGNIIKLSFCLSAPYAFASDVRPWPWPRLPRPCVILQLRS